MKKPALIRSDKPHAVQVTEGSSVAQRKSSAPKSAVPSPAPAPDNTQKAAPAKAVKAKRSPPPEATEVAPPPPRRAVKAKAKPAAKAARRPARKTPATTAAVAAAPVAPVAPPVPVWEQDNPVKARMEELRTLNAQLSEQLQRLPTSRLSRGSMS